MHFQSSLNDARRGLPRRGRGFALGIALCWLPLVTAVAAPPSARPTPAPYDIVGREAARRTAEWRARLPESIGAWTRADTLRTFDDETIFDYMNGAAELYIGYRFTQLDVCDYTSAELDDIQVEIYSMRSSDDAFGLLSQDWRGELVILDASSSTTMLDDGRPVARALYAEGRLRLWSDGMYAILMAYRTGDETRDTLIELGRALVAGRRQPPPPTLLAAIPYALESGLRLRQAHGTYLRSRHVLGTFLDLGTENLLELGQRTEVMLAMYVRDVVEGKVGELEAQRKQSPAGGMQLLYVRYPEPEQAKNVFRRLRDAHVEDQAPIEFGEPDKPAADRIALHREDGWASCIRQGSTLALVFGCPDARTAGRHVEQALARLAALPRSD